MTTRLEIVQWQSLRDEIGRLQVRNESLLERTLLIFAGSWSVYASGYLSKGGAFDALILLGPGFLSAIALARYTVNQRRVANIASFLAEAFQKDLGVNRNWEAKISEFSRCSGIDLGSGFTARFFYLVVIRLSVYGALLRLFDLPNSGNDLGVYIVEGGLGRRPLGQDDAV